MRPIRLLLALACTVPLAAEVHENVRTYSEVTPITYGELVDTPAQFKYSQVKFRCTFASVSGLFDPLTTPFTPEQYRNLSVWSDHAQLWIPDERAKAMVTLYIPKDNEDAQKLETFKKYEILDITGRVMDVIDGIPWVRVTSIEPVEKSGAFSDNALYHMEQGQSLAADGVHDLADRHFLAAENENLPIYGAVAVRSLRARQLAAAGHNHEAMALLESALKLATLDKEILPSDLAQAHALLAKVENDTAEGSATEARQELLTKSVANASAAIAYDPTLADAYAVLGISLAGLGRFDDARRECDNALRLRPNDAEVRWYLGRILDQQGKYDDAIDALKKAIDLTPKDARIHKAVAVAFFHRGLKGGPTAAADLRTALREDDIAERLNPGDAETLYSSGQVLAAAAASGAEVMVAGQGNVAATSDMAIERYRAAIAADESFAPAHLALALALRDHGKPEETLSQLERVVELQPDDFASVQALCRFMADNNRQANATALYEQYLGRHPFNSQVRIELDRLYSRNGDQPHLLGLQQGLDDLVKKNEHSAAALIALAEFRLAHQDPGSAANLAGQAVGFAGNDYQEHLAAESTLGKARWELGDAKATVAILAPIVDQLTDQHAVLDLGWAYSCLNKANETRAIADKLRTGGMAVGESKEFIGWSYYVAGDYPTAEGILRTLDPKQVEDATRSYRLGMAIFRQGSSRYPDAKPLLETASHQVLNGAPALFINARNEISDALQAMSGVVGSTSEAAPRPPPRRRPPPPPTPARRRRPRSPRRPPPPTRTRSWRASRAGTPTTSRARFPSSRPWSTSSMPSRRCWLSPGPTWPTTA